MIIYKVINKINKKCYIGQTIKLLQKRKNDHHCQANLKSNNYFARTLRKYGKDNFEWEVIEKCNSKNELDEMEFHYIKQYNSFKPNGYNLTLGGDAGTYGWIPSKETREKISKANKGRKCKPFTKEHKKQISEANKGRKQLHMMGENNPAKRPEVRKKISEALKGRKLSNEHLKKLCEMNKGKTYEEIYGIKRAKEIRKNHSIAKKGNKNIGQYKRTNETKEKFRQSRAKFLYTIKKPDGTIEETNSIRNFCKLNNLDKGSMFYHFKNNTNNHKGYKIISRRKNEI
jgi:group I intron endonuclease